MVCTCRLVGVWRRHGSYYKYFRGNILRIFRLRCSACHRTHAIMPSFSVPNSSHDTESVDAYLLARSQGATRQEAAQGLSLADFSYSTWKRLDQRAELRSRQLKAVEADPARSSLSGYRYLKASADKEFPVGTLNQRYLASQGRGWLFGNPEWLNRCPYAGTAPPHTLATPRWQTPSIDSS